MNKIAEHKYLYNTFAVLIAHDNRVRLLTLWKISFYLDHLTRKNLRNFEIFSLFFNDCFDWHQLRHDFYRFKRKGSNSLRIIGWFIETDVQTYGAYTYTRCNPDRPQLHQTRVFALELEAPLMLHDREYQSRAIPRWSRQCTVEDRLSTAGGSSTDVLQAQACAANIRYFRRQPPARGRLMSDQLILE